MQSEAFAGIGSRAARAGFGVRQPLHPSEVRLERPEAPQTPAEARARFLLAGHVPDTAPSEAAAAFLRDEAEVALFSGGTGFHICDLSPAIGCSHPATTPAMLVRYAAVAPHASLTADFTAAGSLWYVIRGSGTASVGDERIAFSPRDIFLLPGGAPATLIAADGGAVLWVVTNEPQFATAGAHRAASAGREPAIVHYPSAEIAAQLMRTAESLNDETPRDNALIFSCELSHRECNLMAALTLSVSTIGAGERHDACRHSPTAVALVLRGSLCACIVGEERWDWTPYATLVTPGGMRHSFHNDGADHGMLLMVQEGAPYRPGTPAEQAFRD